MEGKDNIKELFSQKLGNYEAQVNPELWAKISLQVAAGATKTVATGLSVFAKAAIGLGISAAAITMIVLLTNTPEETVSEKPNTEVQQEISNENTSETKKVAEVKNQSITQTTNSIVENSQQNVTPTTSITPDVSITPGIDSRHGVDSYISIAGMKPKDVTQIGNKGLSKPTIVEGVVHSETTKYGGSPSDPDPDIVTETPTPKASPIKRYTNIFTPNGDRSNDEFFLRSEGLTDFTVVVLSPTGDKVFESNDPDFIWDGRDMRTGETVESGNYMYMVSAYDSEGNPHPIYERLTIISN